MQWVLIHSWLNWCLHRHVQMKLKSRSRGSEACGKYWSYSRSPMQKFNAGLLQPSATCPLVVSQSYNFLAHTFVVFCLSVSSCGSLPLGCRVQQKIGPGAGRHPSSHPDSWEHQRPQNPTRRSSRCSESCIRWSVQFFLVVIRPLLFSGRCILFFNFFLGGCIP